jgi:pilus assembly protein CpaB
MKLQYVGLIGLGLICAVCATLLVMFNRSTAEVQSDDVEVVVASRDIEPMSKITEDMCETRKTSRAQSPKSAIGSATKVVGQVITVKLVKGQPFTDAVFAPEGSGFYVASMLLPGQRAFPIAVADHSVLDGLLYPGSNVDVIVSFDMRGRGDSKQGVLSKTLLRNIQVLAVENRTMATAKDEPNAARSDSARRKITLLVSPEQCERLRLAMDYGNISLALRGPTDKSEDPTRVTRLEDIGLPPDLIDELQGTKQVAAAPPAPAPAAPTLTPVPVVPVNLEPEPAAKPATVAAKEEPEEEMEVPMWVTTVLRGGATTTSAFPIPGAEPVPVRKVKPKTADNSPVRGNKS